LFSKIFSVSCSDISSSVPCHHNRSIIPAFQLYIKEEMKACENTEEIKKSAFKKAGHPEQT
jgi:hypothetical protein